VLNGHKAVVIGGPYATHLIVTARTGGGQRDAQGISVFIVETSAAGVTARLSDRRRLPGLRGHAENVHVGADAWSGRRVTACRWSKRWWTRRWPPLRRGLRVLQKLHEGTLDYTKQRQAVRPAISAFQVLQHRMVDMFIQVEQAVSMTYMATIKLADDGQRTKSAAAAKVQIGKACKFVRPDAIQLHRRHGHDRRDGHRHYFKRATMIESAFGSTDHHLARYEFLSLGQAA